MLMILYFIIAIILILVAIIEDNLSIKEILLFSFLWPVILFMIAIVSPIILIDHFFPQLKNIAKEKYYSIILKTKFNMLYELNGQLKVDKHEQFVKKYGHKTFEILKNKKLEEKC